MHEKSNHHTCEFCAKKFFTKIELKRHEETNHQNIDKVNCQYCGLEFMNSETHQITSQRDKERDIKMSHV